MDDVASAHVYLEKEPKTTTEYVALLEYMDQLTMKIDFLEADLDYAKDLYDITDEYQIAIDNEDVEAYLNCGQYINGLRNMSDQIIDNKEKVIDKLGNCITHDFDELMIEVTNLKVEISVSRGNFLFAFCLPKLTHERHKIRNKSYRDS